MLKNISNENLNRLIKLREKLHSQPELANDESKTAVIIKDYISQYSPDKIIENIGGNGIAYVYNGIAPGPSVMIRAELDALPIIEENEFKYRSVKPGISHKCGHDGHMTILAGLAELLYKEKIETGRVILLFQPAEETGEGAKRVIEDQKFSFIKPDFVFAVHNLPGFEMHDIILKDNTFAAASVGMIIKLYGKTSHAGHPENGISPAIAVSEIIRKFDEISLNQISRELEFGLITIINVVLGERAIGTAPGYAEVLATLRTNSDDDLKYLSEKCVKAVNRIARNEKLKSEIQWTENFPATVNETIACSIIKKSAAELNLKVKEIRTPFRWTEDFGQFTNIYKGALFGLGAGNKTPQLHNPDYDFPDELIQTGINIFQNIIYNLLCSKSNV